MQTVDDISYGVVPVRKEGLEWKVFLIHQFGLQGDVYWTFPKGHPEDGEAREQTSLRELSEETGIIDVMLQKDKTYEQSYTFPFENTFINKKVFYYVGIVTSKEFTIQTTEVQEAGWFTFDEAIEKLSYQRLKEMCKEIKEDIMN